MNEQWLDEAKCKDMNPLRFDLMDRRVYEPEAATEAQRLCSGCKVVQQCATEAIRDIGYRLQTTTRAGVWVPDTTHPNYRAAMAALIDIAKGRGSC